MDEARLSHLLSQKHFDDEDCLALLSLTDPHACQCLYREAAERTEKMLGHSLFFRALIEISNLCIYDCRYCGIRKHNFSLKRYSLSIEEILAAARCAFKAGYSCLALQSGERTDAAFVDFICEVLEALHALSVRMGMPQGCGMTLSFGEQTRQTYERWAKASGNRSALRYLLRVETSNPELFNHIHGGGRKRKVLLERYLALQDLREAGYQVGTGVMIGIPGQTLEDLVDDLRAFDWIDPDMFGMGPYIVSEGGDMLDEGMLDTQTLLCRTLNMIAVTRLRFPTCNIAAATALDALVSNGRVLGVQAGCNVLMPNMTPTECRVHYDLYEKKASVDSGEDASLVLETALRKTGRTIDKSLLGSSRHFLERRGLTPTERQAPR